MYNCVQARQRNTECQQNEQSVTGNTVEESSSDDGRSS